MEEGKLVFLTKETMRIKSGLNSGASSLLDTTFLIQQQPRHGHLLTIEQLQQHQIGAVDGVSSQTGYLLESIAATALIAANRVFYLHDAGSDNYFDKFTVVARVRYTQDSDIMLLKLTYITIIILFKLKLIKAHFTGVTVNYTTN